MEIWQVNPVTKRPHARAHTATHSTHITRENAFSFHTRKCIFVSRASKACSGLARHSGGRNSCGQCDVCRRQFFVRQYINARAWHMHGIELGGFTTHTQNPSKAHMCGHACVLAWLRSHASRYVKLTLELRRKTNKYPPGLA